MIKPVRWWSLLKVASRMIRLRFMRKTVDHQLAKQAIAEQLSELGGIAMKLGQVVADAGQGDEFRILLDKEKARPLTEMRPVLELELKQSWSDVFVSIEESTSAASLGQVHKAQLTTGEIVAIKIQYPYIGDAVNAELKLAGLMPGLGPVKKWGMDLNAYKQTLKHNMEQELDYRSEAERQQLFAQKIKVEGLVIPEVYAHLSTKKVLVQSWQEGVLLDQILTWSKVERMLIGRTLLMTLLQSVFQLGEVHGDPHMGNFFYRRGKSNKLEVVMLDYGCTLSISRQARLALLQLIISARTEATVKTSLVKNSLTNFVSMGFEEKKLAHIAQELPLLIQVLFKPFLQDKPFLPENWQIKASFEQLLADKKWWFRSAGPAELFLLMRAFQGTVRQLERLQVHLPWWPILIQAVNKEVIQQAEDFIAEPLEMVANDMILNDIEETEVIAQRLKIHIIKAGQTLIDMSLPAMAALELEEMLSESLPADMQQKIMATLEFDFQQLQQMLFASRFKAQTILDFEQADKHYKIWLE